MTIPTNPLLLAIDPGAGNTKVFSPTRSESIRSLVEYRPRETFLVGLDVLANDVLHCLNSSNQELVDKYWVVGENVAIRKMEPPTPSQDPSLKVSNALPVILGALITKNFIYPGDSNVVLCISHHSPTTEGPKLIEAISGLHRIVYQENEYRIQIKFSDRAVVLEGSAIAPKGDVSDYSTIDIGELTALLIKRYNGQPIGDPVRTRKGVGHLVTLLSKHPLVMSQLGGTEANRVAISSALIEASNRYAKGGKGKLKVVYRAEGQAVDITDAYNAAMKAWVKEAIAPALAALKEHEGLDYTVVAVGGGVNLPVLDELFKRRGIEIFDGNPIFANVQSIYERFLAGHEEDEWEFVPFTDALADLEETRQQIADELASRRSKRGRPRKTPLTPKTGV